MAASNSHGSSLSPGASSSRPSPSRQPGVEDGEEDDLTDLLASDPLGIDIGQGLSFKLKQPHQNSAFSLPRLFGTTSASSPHNQTPTRSSPAPQAPFPPPPQQQQSRLSQHIRSHSQLSVPQYYHDDDGSDKLNLANSNNIHDWHPDGTRRTTLHYDDLTAIDWIFEYSKERARQRTLASRAAQQKNIISGYVLQIADASQIWLVLIATGLAAGTLAAFIGVASDWLGDLKAGVCSGSHGGGRFYLSRPFCCWGIDELASCRDWNTWSALMHVRSAAGGFIVEYIVFILFSVLFAAIAALLVRNYATYAKHSGIPEIKTLLGGFIIRRFLGPWTLAIKSLGLCLTVASGLWLGKEGPLVHVACCCANLFLKAFDSLNTNEARKREVLSAAAAAGISVAFGSPIGGVLFSLEQLSYYFPDKTMWQSFVCAMVAAVTLQAFNPFRTGKLVLYQVTYHSGWHDFEIVPFALLGILGGLYGGLFIKLNMKVAQWRKNRTYLKGPVLEVIIIAVVTAIVNFPIKFMRAQASELVYTLFAECVDITDDQLGLCVSGKANTAVVALLLVAAVLGFFLAAITFGLQIPAGIILPSMAIGALYGRAVGLIVEVWQAAHPSWFIFAACEPDRQCVTPGTYAIIGAASALGGATRMTVSIVVIMFELTGALTYVLPIMVAVMLSKWVGDAISPRGIYESWIQFNGYPYLDNRDETLSNVSDVRVNEVMTRIEDLVVIAATGHTIDSLKNILDSYTFRGFPIIDNARDAVLLGYISRTELTYALDTVAKSRSLSQYTEVFFIHQPLADAQTTLDLRPWMDHTPIILNANASFGLAVSMFQKLGLRYIIFAEKGALKGLLTKKDVWLVLNGQRAEALSNREAMLAENVDADEDDGVSRGLMGNEEDEEQDRVDS